MKKKGGLITLISFVLLCIMFNVIIFLTLPDGRANDSEFIVAWVFAFGINLLLSVGVFFYSKGKGDFIIRLPLVYLTWIIGFAIYLVANSIFFYVTAVTIKAVWITNVIITILYAIFAMYLLFGLHYMSSNVEHTKKKVFYIRSLTVQVEGAYPFVTDTTLLEKLKKLADDIRYSDPMTHDSLASCEEELKSAVSKISMYATMGEMEKIEQEVATASKLLIYRNNQCKILK